MHLSGHSHAGHQASRRGGCTTGDNGPTKPLPDGTFHLGLLDLPPTDPTATSRSHNSEIAVANRWPHGIRGDEQRLAAADHGE